MEIYTKEQIIEKLKQIRDLGWIPSNRQGNHGGIGNTLEDLLGIKENNLPIANAAEWELKCQRANSGSLTTLFHLEPSPKGAELVSTLLLPKYGWKHKSAGIKYGEGEKSFRQTINAVTRTDRGFKVVVNRQARKIEVSFDATTVSPIHAKWLESVKERVGNLDELYPQPYWGFDDLFHKTATKLTNMFYVIGDRKFVNRVEHFHYRTIMMLSGLDQAKFIDSIEQNLVLIDFDARTGHNHGTKFRFRLGRLHELYNNVTLIE
jgi:hypothetical protein